MPPPTAGEPGGRTWPKRPRREGSYLCLFPLLTRSSMSRIGVASSCSRLFSGGTGRSKYMPSHLLRLPDPRTPRTERLLHSAQWVWPPETLPRGRTGAPLSPGLTSIPALWASGSPWEGPEPEAIPKEPCSVPQKVTTSPRPSTNKRQMLMQSPRDHGDNGGRENLQPVTAGPNSLKDTGISHSPVPCVQAAV